MSALGRQHTSKKVPRSDVKTRQNGYIVWPSNGDGYTMSISNRIGAIPSPLLQPRDRRLLPPHCLRYIDSLCIPPNLDDKRAHCSTWQVTRSKLLTGLGVNSDLHGDVRFPAGVHDAPPRVDSRVASKALSAPDILPRRNSSPISESQSAVAPIRYRRVK